MGRRIKNEVYALVVEAERVPLVLAIINDMDHPTVLERWASGCTYDGEKIRRHYAGRTERPPGGWTNILDAFKAWGFDGFIGESGAFFAGPWNAETLGDEGVLLKLIAPYLQGLDIEVDAEDGATWRWVVRDGSLRESPKL